MISRKSQLILTGGAALGLTLIPASGAFAADASSTEAPAPAATTSTSPAATTSTPSATSTAASSTPTATPTAAAPAAADGDAAQQQDGDAVARQAEAQNTADAADQKVAEAQKEADAADQKVADAESRVPDAQQKVADAQAAKDSADAAAAPAQQALDDAVAGLADAEADPAAAVPDLAEAQDDVIAKQQTAIKAAEERDSLAEAADDNIDPNHDWDLASYLLNADMARQDAETAAQVLATAQTAGDSAAISTAKAELITANATYLAYLEELTETRASYPSTGADADTAWVKADAELADAVARLGAAGATTSDLPTAADTAAKLAVDQSRLTARQVELATRQAVEAAAQKVYDATVTDPALSAEITTRTTESTVLTTQAHRVADADEVIAPLDAQTAADAALQAAQKALAKAQAALVAAPEDLDRKAAVEAAQAAVDKAQAADDAAIVIWDNPYHSINPGFWYGHDYFEQDLQAYESTVVAGTTDPTLKAAREAVVDTYRAWDAAQIDYVNAWFGAGATAGQREAVDTTKTAYLAAVDALNAVEPAYPQAYVDAKAALDNAHLQTLIAQYDADGAQVRVIWDVATLKLIKGAAELEDLDALTSAAGEAQATLDTIAPAQNKAAKALEDAEWSLSSAQNNVTYAQEQQTEAHAALDTAKAAAQEAHAALDAANAALNAVTPATDEEVAALREIATKADADLATAREALIAAYQTEADGFEIAEAKWEDHSVVDESALTSQKEAVSQARQAVGAKQEALDLVTAQGGDVAAAEEELLSAYRGLSAAQSAPRDARAALAKTTPSVVAMKKEADDYFAQPDQGLSISEQIAALQAEQAAYEEQAKARDAELYAVLTEAQAALEADPDDADAQAAVDEAQAALDAFEQDWANTSMSYTVEIEHLMYDGVVSPSVPAQYQAYLLAYETGVLWDYVEDSYEANVIAPSQEVLDGYATAKAADDAADTALAEALATRTSAPAQTVEAATSAVDDLKAQFKDAAKAVDTADAIAQAAKDAVADLETALATATATTDKETTHLSGAQAALAEAQFDGTPTWDAQQEVMKANDALNAARVTQDYAQGRLDGAKALAETATAAAVTAQTRLDGLSDALHAAIDRLSELLDAADNGDNGSTGNGSTGAGSTSTGSTGADGSSTGSTGTGSTSTGATEIVPITVDPVEETPATPTPGTATTTVTDPADGSTVSVTTTTDTTSMTVTVKHDNGGQGKAKGHDKAAKENPGKAKGRHAKAATPKPAAVSAKGLKAASFRAYSF